jgi:hypothetical protein
VGHAIKTAAVTLARRVQAINAEISALDTHIEPRESNHPRIARRLRRRRRHRRQPPYRRRRQRRTDPLRSRLDTPVRRRAHPAGSGKTNGRHRLNPGGNRQANHALWRIVITRLGQGEPRSVAYMQRRLADGRTKPEIIRALKRYVAREIYQQLPA